MKNEKLMNEAAGILETVADKLETKNAILANAPDTEEMFFAEVKPLLEGKSQEEILDLLKMSLYMSFMTSLYAFDLEGDVGVEKRVMS